CWGAVRRSPPWWAPSGASRSARRPVGSGWWTWASPSKFPDPVTRKRPTRRPRSGGKKLSRAAEAIASGPSEEVGGTVGPGRGPVGTQADRPAGLGVEGPTSPVVRSDPIRVALSVRVCASQDRQHVRGTVAACEDGADGGGA